MKHISLIIFLTLSLFAVNTGACIGCHNADFSKSALGTSKIVKDMKKIEIKTALQGFKKSTYKGSMKAFASALSNKDIEEIANKFGK